MHAEQLNKKDLKLEQEDHTDALLSEAMLDENFELEDVESGSNHHRIEVGDISLSEPQFGFRSTQFFWLAISFTASARMGSMLYAASAATK